jgi:hypothetical protein
MGLFDVPFWTALVYLRVQILQVEDLPPMYQQSLIPFVWSEMGNIVPLTCGEDACARLYLEKRREKNAFDYGAAKLKDADGTDGWPS